MSDFEYEYGDENEEWPSDNDDNMVDEKEVEI